MCVQVSRHCRCILPIMYINCVPPCVCRSAVAAGVSSPIMYISCVPPCVCRSAVAADVYYPSCISAVFLHVCAGQPSLHVYITHHVYQLCSSMCVQVSRHCRCILPVMYINCVPPCVCRSAVAAGVYHLSCISTVFLHVCAGQPSLQVYITRHVYQLCSSICVQVSHRCRCIITHHVYKLCSSMFVQVSHRCRCARCWTCGWTTTGNKRLPRHTRTTPLRPSPLTGRVTRTDRCGMGW